MGKELTSKCVDLDVCGEVRVATSTGLDLAGACRGVLHRSRTSEAMAAATAGVIFCGTCDCSRSSRQDSSLRCLGIRGCELLLHFSREPCSVRNGISGCGS